MIRQLFYILGILNIPYFSFAQQNPFQPAFINYTVEDGLPSNESYCINQDTNGNIWIGTDRGLVKYNGYEFIVYTQFDGLPNNVIFKIERSPKGKLYFLGADNSLMILRNDSIIQHPLSDTLRKVIKDNFHGRYLKSTNIVIDENDTIHIGSSMYYIKLKDELELVPRTEDLHIINIKKINGKSFFSSFKPKLLLSNVETAIYYNNKLITKKIQLNLLQRLIVTDYKDTTKLFLTYTNKTLSINDSSFSLLNSIGQESLIQKTIPLLNSKIDGYLEKGLVIDDKVIIPNTSVTDIYKDGNNGIWFTTIEKGLFYLPYSRTEIIDLQKEACYKITSSGNELFYSTQYGTIKKLSGNEITTLKKSTSKSSSISAFSFIDQTRFILLSQNVSSKLINIRSPKKKPIELIFGSIPLSAYKINDQLNLISNNKTAILDTNNLSVKFKQNDLVVKSTNNYNNTILIGAKYGLYKFSENTISKYPLNHEYLDNNRINSIKSIKEEFWIGSIGKGLFIYNTNTKTIKNLTTRDGLLSNNITDIEIDNNGRPWIATNKGIHIISANHPYKILKNITKTNGILSNEIFDLHLHQDYIYIANRKGLLRVNTNLNQEANSLFLKINGIKINDVPILLDSNLMFSYDQNNIEFQYASIQYQNKGNIVYQYRIKEIDTTWYETSSRTARFPDLNYGDHTFELRTQTSQNHWSPIISKSFIISPALWQTTWFISLVIILILLLLSSGLYLYYKNKLHRQSLKSDIDKHRYKALTSQMNPHFVFNALNSIQYFILDQKRRSASKYLSTFAKLIRASFENSKQDLILLHDELDALKLYVELENLRLDNRVNVIYYIDPNIDSISVMTPPLIIQPFVENAFIHGLAPKKEGNLTWK